jgi:hypothetical protein
MSSNTLDRELYTRRAPSNTRVTPAQSDAAGTRAIPGAPGRLPESLLPGPLFPDPPEPPGNTRVTTGPPRTDHSFQNEGPAQPALRRFGVRTSFAFRRSVGIRPTEGFRTKGGAMPQA